MTPAPGGVPRIEVLLDHKGAAPETEAEHRYGAALRFADGGSPHVFANFVSTLDGVVSLGIGDGSDSATVSGRHPADRYVMALLRAAADAILIGAGTLAASPGHRWDHRTLVPEAAPELAAFRAARQLPPEPPALLVVSGSGRLRPHAALRPSAGVVVVTSEEGAAAMREDHPGVNTVVAGEGPVLDGGAIIAAATRATGATTLLCEGGPHLTGTLVAAGVLSEIFLSISALVAGRDPAHLRPGWVAGVAFEPAALQHAELRSARAAGGLLLLRYRMKG